MIGKSTKEKLKESHTSPADAAGYCKKVVSDDHRYCWPLALQ
jgi:hypothetical protein